MKKSLKDTIKEIWADDPYDLYGDDYGPPKDRPLGAVLLETGINLVRFELLYPKYREEHDGDSPKGFFPAVIANAALGYYIGSQVNGDFGAVTGSLLGVVCIMPQMVLGAGVRGISNSISEKCKERKEKKNSLSKII